MVVLLAVCLAAHFGACLALRLAMALTTGLSNRGSQLDSTGRQGGEIENVAEAVEAAIDSNDILPLVCVAFLRRRFI